MEPHRRVRGTPRPRSSYRASRRNEARDQARKERRAGVSRQWWRWWGGIQPTRYAVAVKTTHTAPKRYPAGWRTLAEREARVSLAAGQR